MTKGVGVGTEMFGETKGELVKPGMTRADLEAIEKRGFEGPDPFGDVFNEAKGTPAPVSDVPAKREPLPEQSSVVPGARAPLPDQSTLFPSSPKPLGPALGSSF